MAFQDTAPTKRERQKQRRDAKLAVQRQQSVRARRNRLIVLAVVAVVAVAAVGVVVERRLSERRRAQETLALAEARQGELGCTEITDEPDLGAGHLPSDPAQLAAAPPDVLYPDRPASSGQHYESWVLSGAYDEPIDERFLVHNLEHGYVNVYFDEEADAGQVAELKEYAEQQIGGEYPKLVVAPYGEPLPDDANFATLSWGHRQLCRDFDTEVAAAFIAQHHNGSEAPERFLPPHLSTGQGVDPDEVDGPLLLPPLADSEAAPSAEDAVPAPSGTGGEDG